MVAVQYLSVRIKAAVHMDDPAEVGQPRWERNRLLPEGRQLVVTIGELTLFFSEAAARWFLGMIEAMMPTGPEGADRSGWTGEAIRSGPAVRIQVVGYVCHAADIGRPRWDGAQLVVTAGDLVLMFSEPTVSRLMNVLGHAQ